MYFAAVLGAKVIEKHFTINRIFQGLIKMFIEPKELKEMIKQIRSFYKMAEKEIFYRVEELSLEKI